MTGRPGSLARLNEMHTTEPQMIEQIGVTPATITFIIEAFAKDKLIIWVYYPDDGEIALARRRCFNRLQG